MSGGGREADLDKGMELTLVELLGEDKAKWLAWHRGGQRVYIPGEDRLSADHWLVRLLDWPGALAMSFRFPRQSVELPLGIHGVRNKALALVDKGIRGGASNNQLVRASGLSSRTIRRRRRWLEGEAARPRPPSLLDHLREEKE